MIESPFFFYFKSFLSFNYKIVDFTMLIWTLVTAEILQNCVAPYFWENVHDSFSCFNIEIAYSNFTFRGAYTLSFIACHTISAKRAHLPSLVVEVWLEGCVFIHC